MLKADSRIDVVRFNSPAHNRVANNLTSLICDKSSEVRSKAHQTFLYRFEDSWKARKENSLKVAEPSHRTRFSVDSLTSVISHLARNPSQEFNTIAESDKNNEKCEKFDSLRRGKRNFCFKFHVILLRYKNPSRLIRTFVFFSIKEKKPFDKRNFPRFSSAKSSE